MKKFLLILWGYPLISLISSKSFEISDLDFLTGRSYFITVHLLCFVTTWTGDGEVILKSAKNPDFRRVIPFQIHYQKGGSTRFQWNRPKAQDMFGSYLIEASGGSVSVTGEDRKEHCRDLKQAVAMLTGVTLDWSFKVGACFIPEHFSQAYRGMKKAKVDEIGDRYRLSFEESSGITVSAEVGKNDCLFKVITDWKLNGDIVETHFENLQAE
jgi:hypothetical protein